MDKLIKKNIRNCLVILYSTEDKSNLVGNCGSKTNNNSNCGGKTNSGVSCGSKTNAMPLRC